MSLAQLSPSLSLRKVVMRLHTDIQRVMSNVQYYCRHIPKQHICLKKVPGLLNNSGSIYLFIAHIVSIIQTLWLGYSKLWIICIIVLKSTILFKPTVACSSFKSCIVFTSISLTVSAKVTVQTLLQMSNLWIRCRWWKWLGWELVVVHRWCQEG